MDFSKYFNIDNLGDACREWRHQNGFKLRNVGHDLGYSENNIWNFERGNNNSATIFLWYLCNGFTIDFYNDYCKRGGVKPYGGQT